MTDDVNWNDHLDVISELLKRRGFEQSAWRVRRAAEHIEELEAALFDVLDGQGWLSSGPWDIAEACGVSEERAAEIQNMIRAAKGKNDD